MFDKIPSQLPLTPLLDAIDAPRDLRTLSRDQLPDLARELRAYLLYSVGQTGGHFGAGLGVVELTIALHYCFNTPDDALVWDVGHQTYPHKILTERKSKMASLRQRGGLKGFPARSESPYDFFGVGHSSTSISAALGNAIANDMQNRDQHSVAIIGDGAMTAGMAFEALNHAGHLKSNMLVVLNDNRMSISENVGGLSNYFARIWASRTYNSLREGGKKVLKDMPSAMTLARRTEEHMKGMVSPGTLFEEIGFNYIGPIDGHDIDQLIEYFERIKLLKGPRLLHVATQKGKGFLPAEKDPIGYHALNKIEGQKQPENEPTNPLVVRQKYSDVFGDWLCDLAAQDERVVAITPAMREGSGMVRFSQEFPDRYHDVAIAEQHSVTLAAGLACGGQKPVVAIYSTFLQRAYDQLIHDVAIQNLDVLFAIDRAGLVGEDGPTHAGVYDLSYLRCIPNMVVMAPSNEQEARDLLYTGYCLEGPAAVRYPRGKGPGVKSADARMLPIGKANVLLEGQQVAVLAFGAMVSVAQSVAVDLGYTLVDMRFVKPLDVALIQELASSHQLIVTVEENAVQGGAGSAVNEFLIANDLMAEVSILNLGVPDLLIEQGTQAEMRDECGLTPAGIRESIEQRLTRQGDHQASGLSAKYCANVITS